MNAVILAGEDYKKSKNALRNKAGILINGVPMINYVINALKEVSSINRIVVVGDELKLRSFLDSSIYLFNQNGTMFNNLTEGVKYLESEENLLVVTCDIPLIDRGIIESFMMKANETKGDLCYPIIERKHCEQKYPELNRTYVTLKDGVYTGGNIILINPSILASIEEAQILINHRKNPLLMAYNLGIGFLYKLLTKQLTIRQIEDYFSKSFHIRARAIITEFPELGCDVDTEEHVNKINEILHRLHN